MTGADWVLAALLVAGTCAVGATGTAAILAAKTHPQTISCYVASYDKNTALVTLNGCQ